LAQGGDGADAAPRCNGIGPCADSAAGVVTGKGTSNSNNRHRKKPSKAPTPLPPVPEIWPRLEDGAVICKSRDDLVKYQTQIANSRSATTAGQASDCHTIRKQTGH